MSDAVNIYIRKEPVSTLEGNTARFHIQVKPSIEFMTDTGTYEEKIDYITSLVKEELYKKYTEYYSESDHILSKSKIKITFE